MAPTNYQTILLPLAIFFPTVFPFNINSPLSRATPRHGHVVADHSQSSKFSFSLASSSMARIKNMESVESVFDSPNDNVQTETGLMQTVESIELLQRTVSTAITKESLESIEVMEVMEGAIEVMDPQKRMEIAYVKNVEMHMQATQKSESTFYGYYPEGFTEFDLEGCPSDWTVYKLDGNYAANVIESSLKERDETDMIATATNSIWDTLLQLDQNPIPPPFSNPADLARTSTTPILTQDECHEIISECESHYYGWGSSNERYGTPKDRVGYMISLEDLSRTYTLVNFELLPRLFPTIMNAFGSTLNDLTSVENLRLGGCRVVKYDASDGHVELGLHRDGLLITANIALNDLNEYEGGGTVVEGLPSYMSNPIRLPKGHVLLHPGDVRHGGAPITKGVRYVLVCFIFDASIVPHEKYCHDRMKEDVERARAISISMGVDHDERDFEGREGKIREREELLASATRHCADAYMFGRMAALGEVVDGYDDMVKSFEKFGFGGGRDNERDQVDVLPLL